VAAAQEHQQYYPYVTQGRHFAEVVLGGRGTSFIANDNRFTPFGFWGLIRIADHLIVKMCRGTPGQLTLDMIGRDIDLITE